MRRAVRVACVIGFLSSTPAFAQEATLLEKFKDWSAYATTGNPKVCFVVSQPKTSLPKGVRRGPIYFYISRYPADQVTGEISVKMGYPFAPGAKTTVTIGSDKFEMFTKEEGSFVEKQEDETKLVDAMKGGTSMKIDGRSARGTDTSDEYSLDGLAEALERIAKECAI
jgi:invasion protein IalB